MSDRNAPERAAGSAPASGRFIPLLKGKPWPIFPNRPPERLPAGRTAPSRAGRGPPPARRARRAMRSPTACAAAGRSCSTTRTRPSFAPSRPRCRRSSCPKAGSRPIWQAASSWPPGAPAALTSSRRACSDPILRPPATESDPRAKLGTGLVQDNYGPRALATLLRYRGSVLAELFRSLAALKRLQAEARQPSGRGRAGRGLAPAVTERTRESAAEQRLGLQPRL